MLFLCHPKSYFSQKRPSSDIMFGTTVTIAQNIWFAIGLPCTLQLLQQQTTMTTKNELKSELYAVEYDPKPAAEFTEEELTHLNKVLTAYFDEMIQVFGGESDVIEVSLLTSS